MQLNRLGGNTRSRGRLRGRRVADGFDDLQVDQCLRRRQRARHGAALADGRNECRELARNTRERAERVLAIMTRTVNPKAR